MESGKALATSCSPFALIADVSEYTDWEDFRKRLGTS